MTGEEIIELQKLVTRVPVSDQVLGYAWALVRASRPGMKEAPEFVNKWVNWGAGPRGVLTLVMCAKARAILHGRYHATIGGYPEAGQTGPPPPHRRQLCRASQQRRQRTDDRNADGSVRAIRSRSPRSTRKSSAIFRRATPLGKSFA
jgi:hypothetical protein